VAKNLIIGGFTNYNYNQLKPWVESIDESGFQGDKVLVFGNASEETLKQLSDRNFKLIPMQNSNMPIHVARFLYIYEYLREHWKEYNHVITTDVKDVYFQTNPTEWLEGRLDGFKIICGSEGIRYKDESWGDENLKQCYGEYIYNLFKDNEIYNVGVLAGKSEYIKDLVFNIFTNAVNRPIPIVDQAVFNVLINTQPYKDCTYFAKQYYGWACHAGTTVDPSKIERFRPNLTEPEPHFKDGIVYSSNGEPFCIVHQYDRVPEWKEFVMNKYNQEDESNYFRYKTA
jgi:hypothetical protein